MILAIVISAITAVKPLPSHFDAINTSDQLWYWFCNGQVLVTIIFIFKWFIITEDCLMTINESYIYVMITKL